VAIRLVVVDKQSSPLRRASVEMTILEMVTLEMAIREKVDLIVGRPELRVRLRR
jgi:hypothetical protein